ncbi:zinc finger protein ZFP2-like [Chaetodon trifascialis]|uniref:zinc finger protein ZFP2-like n=1 Tax=Chaetodon trifascialis TaxID=109706 RepID=UPI003995798F
MSKVQTLRAFVEQRLTAAAEEIMELFGRTIAEYEEELCGQRKLLDAVFQPEVRLHRADVQLLSASPEEDPPEQQDWSPSLDQEDPAELPHIKEEQEELWSSQEGEQLPGPEEADITKSTVPPVPVKTEEEDEEKPQSSQLHQRHAEDMETEAGGEDCGGLEPPRSSDPDRHLEADSEDETSQSSDPETDDSCDWEETRGPQSGLKPLQNNEVPGSDVKCNTGQTSVSSSECASSFDHSGVQTGEKPFSCSVCGRTYPRKNSLMTHMRLHSEGKRFSCSVCEKTFQWRANFMRHMRVHTGEKPFSCSVCGKGFTQKDHQKQHMRIHTDVQLLSASPEEDPPEQQDWSPRLDQEDPAELPHIKEEQEELWSSQEGEQLPGPEEADITKSTVPPVPVKSEEEDEEKPQSSQLHQRHAEDMETEAGGEDCGGPEAARSSDPDRPETDDSCDWEETRGPQSGLKPLQNKEVPGSDVKCNTGQTSVSSSECASSFDHGGAQTGEKPFSCSVCNKTFQRREHMEMHMRIHTGEKLFGCSVCGRRFTQGSTLTSHFRVHTGEKPFSCSVCHTSFRFATNLSRHMRIHTGEKPFRCSVCGKGFGESGTLKRHLTVHTGEKPFSCSVCEKRFTRQNHVKKHKCAGESRRLL